MKIKNLLLKPKLTEELVKGNKGQKKTRCGYGACSAYGCNCREYEGSGYTCENCGHHYDRHW